MNSNSGQKPLEIIYKGFFGIKQTKLIKIFGEKYINIIVKNVIQRCSRKKHLWITQKESILFVTKVWKIYMNKTNKVLLRFNQSFT